jgi:hypothetical protein
MTPAFLSRDAGISIVDNNDFVPTQAQATLSENIASDQKILFQVYNGYEQQAGSARRWCRYSRCSAA